MNASNRTQITAFRFIPREYLKQVDRTARRNVLMVAREISVTVATHRGSIRVVRETSHRLEVDIPGTGRIGCHFPTDPRRGPIGRVDIFEPLGCGSDEMVKKISALLRRLVLAAKAE